MANYETSKETAKKIRGALKKNFPEYGGRHFRVNSTYNSVTVSWQDTPSKQEVDAVVLVYKGISFDGMIDMEDHHGYEDPETGERVQGYSYVRTNHTYSDERYEHLKQILIEKETEVSYQTIDKANDRYDANFNLKDEYKPKLREESDLFDTLNKGKKKFMSDLCEYFVYRNGYVVEPFLLEKGYVVKKDGEYNFNTDLYEGIWIGYIKQFTKLYGNSTMLAEKDLYEHFSQLKTSYIFAEENYQPIIRRFDIFLKEAKKEILGLVSVALDIPDFEKTYQDYLPEDWADDLYFSDYIRQKTQTTTIIKNGIHTVARDIIALVDKDLVEINKAKPNKRTPREMKELVEKVYNDLEDSVFAEEYNLNASKTLYALSANVLLEKYGFDYINYMTGSEVVYDRNYPPLEQIKTTISEDYQRNFEKLNMSKELLYIDLIDEFKSRIKDKTNIFTDELVDVRDPERLQDIQKFLFKCWEERTELNVEGDNLYSDLSLDKYNVIVHEGYGNHELYPETASLPDISDYKGGGKVYVNTFIKYMDVRYENLKESQKREEEPDFTFDFDNGLEISNIVTKELINISQRPEMIQRIKRILENEVLIENNKSIRVKHLFAQHKKNLKTKNGFPYLEYELNDGSYLIQYPHGLTRVSFVEGSSTPNVTHIYNIRLHTIKESLFEVNKAIPKLRELGLDKSSQYTVYMISRHLSLR